MKRISILFFDVLSKLRDKGYQELREKKGAVCSKKCLLYEFNHRSNLNALTRPKQYKHDQEESNSLKSDRNFSLSKSYLLIFKDLKIIFYCIKK